MPSPKEGLMVARRQHREHDAGFTVIEMLVVVAVLGILAGIAVFSISGSGQAAACAAEKSSLRSAQQQYFTKNNAYAPNAATLTTTGYLATAPAWYLTDNSVAPYEVI